MKNILVYIVSLLFIAIFLVAMSGIPVFQNYCKKTNFESTSFLIFAESIGEEEIAVNKSCCSQDKYCDETEISHLENKQENDNNCCNDSFFIVKLIEYTIVQQIKFKFTAATFILYQIFNIKETIDILETVFIDNTDNIYINPGKYLIYFLHQLKIHPH